MTTVDRTVFIMRGIPGSGKSTGARGIARSYPGAFVGTAIHSTDDLCMVDGEYQFDLELASERHEQNYQNFLGSLEKRVPCVIVDNTNVKVSQFAPYVEAAQDAAYSVVFVEMAHPALMVAVDRNTHGVPLEVIAQMMLDWEPSQHSAIMEEAMAKAAKVVEVLQAREKVILWAAIAAGSTLGSIIVALAWWIAP